MKNRLFFGMLFCVNINTLVLSMNNKSIDTKIRTPFARFELNKEKQITTFAIQGSSYNFFDSQKYEDIQDVFSCLILATQDMLALRTGFELLDKGKCFSAEFELSDKHLFASVFLNPVEDKKKYVLLFAK